MDNPAVTWVVEDVAAGGKTNAWNHCVHTTFASCEFICLLDANILCAGDDVIAAALKVLVDDPRAWVVPMGHVLRRLTKLRPAPLATAARRAPAALAATALDLVAAVCANREIKRGVGLGCW